MTNRTITVEHNGTEYAGQIMQVESTAITMADHGIVSAWLHCKAEGGGVGVGGFCLDMPVKDEDGRHSHREGTAYGMDHIMQFIQTVGVESWEAIKGKHVIVLYAGSAGWGGMSVGIASLTNDRVFILKEHAEKWMTAAEVSA